MAASCALPSSALPHAHQQHLHPHSHPQSPSPLSSWRSSMSSETLSTTSADDVVYDEGHGSNYSHTGPNLHAHSHSHSHERSGSYASNRSNRSIPLSRERPPPTSLDMMDGWTLEKTQSGRSVIAPGPDTTATPYSPPRQVHKRMHELQSSESNAERSLFTRTLLPYTAKYPILHAIMTEKDSRRIFYFMTYVLQANCSCTAADVTLTLFEIGSILPL